MNETLTLQPDGARLYVVGPSYPLRDALKRAGCHWDGERRAWWIGAAKRAAVEAVLSRPLPVADVAAAAADRLAHDRGHILGRATYRGHGYYLVGEGQSERGPWVRLLYRDGSRTCFASPAEVEVVTRYRAPRSLDALRAYAEARRQEDAGTAACPLCARHCTCDTGRFCHHHHDGCDRCGAEG